MSPKAKQRRCRKANQRPRQSRRQNRIQRRRLRRKPMAKRNQHPNFSALRAEPEVAGKFRTESEVGNKCGEKDDGGRWRWRIKLRMKSRVTSMKQRRYKINEQDSDGEEVSTAASSRHCVVAAMRNNRRCSKLHIRFRLQKSRVSMTMESR